MARPGEWSYRLGWITVALVSMLSCDRSTPSAPSPAPTQAVISVTISPSPVNAAPCVPSCVGPSGNRFPFQASMMIVVSESAGVGGNVDFINVTPVTDAGLELQVLSYGPEVIVARSGTNHVNARGSLSFPLTILYSTGTTRPALTVSVSLQFTDDLGNRMVGSAQVNVI